VKGGVVVKSQLVGPFVAFARAGGADADRLIREHGLPADVESRFEVELPVKALHRFLEACEAAVGDPLLGLHVAQQLRRGTYGLVEYIARSSETLREVLAGLGRYLALLNPMVAPEFREGEGEATFEYRIRGEPLAYGRHANEMGLGVIVGQGRALAARSWSPRRLWLSHPPPGEAEVKALRRFFGCEVAFNAPGNGFAVDAALLELRISSGDPALRKLLEARAGQELGAAVGGGDFLTQVRDAVGRSLERGPPRMGAVAKAMALSARTLQRRMAEQGTTFQEVVDAVRRELARKYLEDPALGVTEVAYLLGFSELSAFDRAHKRWTGKAPRRGA
jgi:AraC-like DNA-binding protein